MAGVLDAFVRAVGLGAAFGCFLAAGLLGDFTAAETFFAALADFSDLTFLAVLLFVAI